MRLMFFATALAIPFAAYVLIRVLVWAGKFESKLKTLAVRAVIIIAFTPVTLPLLASLFVKSPNAQEASKDTPICISQPVLSKLNSLPIGTALTQIDLGAPILNFTDLSVTSAPYHRNTSGILAALDMFIEDEATAKRTVLNMKADYVIACTESGETKLMLRYGSNGMLAQLKAGKIPDWLEKSILILRGHYLCTA